MTVGTVTPEECAELRREFAAHKSGAPVDSVVLRLLDGIAERDTLLEIIQRDATACARLLQATADERNMANAEIARLRAAATQMIRVYDCSSGVPPEDCRCMVCELEIAIGGAAAGSVSK